MQRSHQAQIGRPVVRLDLFMAVLPFQQYDRFPLVRAESPVDSLCFSLYLRLQIVISLDVSPARRSDLNEREYALIPLIFLQESLDRQESLQNPLGVVQTVHAHSHQCRSNPKA